MTMMMIKSQFGQEDTEALLFGPSSPMVDPLDSILFHPVQEEQPKGGGTSMEGDTSPVSLLASSSSSSSSSPPPFYSPPHSLPDLLHGNKAGNEAELLSVPWGDQAGQLKGDDTVSDDEDDMFRDLDWMSERVDLSDLDTLMRSCSPMEESSFSPDILAPLYCPMEPNCLQLPVSSSSPSPTNPVSLPKPCPDIATICPEFQVSSPPACVPEPQEELEIKSEPVSPISSSPSSPDLDTLDLGSEVDVRASEVKPAVLPVVPQVQRIVLSAVSPTRFVFVLAPKDEVGISTAVTTMSGVIQSSPPASPPTRSSRSRPYPEPKCPASPTEPSCRVKSLPDPSGEGRVSLKAPKNKKLKKMEQNKTAATRYRQKKRAEQEALAAEHAILERRNMELTEKAESMAREIEYLKELMEEVRLTRIKNGSQF